MYVLCVSQFCFFVVGANLVATKHATGLNHVRLRIALVNETRHAELVMQMAFSVIFIDLGKKIINCFQVNDGRPAAGLVAIFAVKKQKEPERANRAIYCFSGLNVSAMNQDKGLLFGSQLYDYRL